MVSRGAVAGPLSGRWRTRSRSRPVHVIDFRAGNLVTVDDSGTREFGPPGSFQAESGESGNELMALLLPNPTTQQLYRGCLREALASVWSSARLGHVETRSWETQNDYIIDNNEGCLAFIQFIEDTCIGVVYSSDPARQYDIRTAIAAMPEQLKQPAQRVACLPLFHWNDRPRHTALFWGEGGKGVGAEPWHVVYKYSGDILRGELLAKSSWCREAAEYYDMPGDVAAWIWRVTQHEMLPASQMAIEVELARELIPSDAPYAAIALEAVTSGGAFAFPARR